MLWQVLAMFLVFQAMSLTFLDTRWTIRFLDANWQILWHRFPTGNNLEGAVSVAAFPFRRHHRVYRFQCRLRVPGSKSRGAQHGPQLHH